MSHEGDTPLTPEEKQLLQDLRAQTKALIEALDKVPPALRKVPVVHPPVETKEARVKIDWVDWLALAAVLGTMLAASVWFWYVIPLLLR